VAGVLLDVLSPPGGVVDMCHVTATAVLLSSGEYRVHRIKRFGLQQQQQQQHIQVRQRTFATSSARASAKGRVPQQCNLRTC
jgi:hypothetical protein